MLDDEEPRPGEEAQRGEETPREEDNSLSRLLTLSDGVFAIAMTLLALDLRVPDLGSDRSEHAIVHALGANADHYWSFALTFYIVASYWVRHRQIMRSAVRVHPNLIRDTLILLLLIAAMPFPASLLGEYGGKPIVMLLYGAINALATIAMILVGRDIRRFNLGSSARSVGEAKTRRWVGWLSLAAFVLCMPAGYLVGSKGLFVLVLLAVPDRIEFLRGLGRGLRPVSPDVED